MRQRVRARHAPAEPQGPLLALEPLEQRPQRRRSTRRVTGIAPTVPDDAHRELLRQRFDGRRQLQRPLGVAEARPHRRDLPGGSSSATSR